MRFRAMKKKNQKKRTYIRRFSKLGLIMRLTQVAMKRLTQVLLTYVKLAFIKLSILSPLYTYSYAVTLILSYFFFRHLLFLFGAGQQKK